MAEDPTAFDRLIRETVVDCKQAIARDFSASVPNYKIILCDNQTFGKLLAREPMYGRKPSSFINRAKGIIVINIEEKLADQWGTFTVELVLDASEELLHAAFPLANEVETKKKSHEFTEKYLQIELPDSYKKRVLENARSPNY
jgi:hypothetical protein